MCKAVYSYGAYHGVVEFYSGRSLSKVVLTEEMDKIYEESVENQEKPLCIDETLVMPVLVW